MKLYAYDRETGEFLNEFHARKNPLDDKKYLTPNYSTSIKPPKTGKKEVAVFEKGEWITKEDLRGEFYYIHDEESDTYQKYIITNIDESIPDNTIDEDDYNKRIEEKNNRYDVKRLSEYPDVIEFIDGMVKANASTKKLREDGEKQLAQYYKKCLAVKKKYPKNK